MGDLRAADLDVERIGAGPPVVLVHGSVVGRERTWSEQRPLAERWTLILPNRPGFGASPPLPRGDFEAEAPLVAELLGGGAHLVGHSYGAVIALCAAGLRPHAVRSLTVSEPGALRLAAGDPEVDTTIANGELLYAGAARERLSPRDFVALFRAGARSARTTPDELPDWLERGARHAMAERPAWEVEPPLAALAAAPFPKLVVSGDHSPVFEAVCDALAARIGAERARIRGRGHSVPATGEPYNALLESFLLRARCARGGGGAR
ncbi:MAG TPA: alpha/beta hydrolase [Conexibacter sp.]|nr:alpha/beta hydrolase [Conexibacter sp.]